MTRPPESERQQLGEELRLLRVRASLSGRKLAPKIGINQSRLVRIERGVTLPHRSEVQAWAAETGADDETRDRLADLAVAGRTDMDTWRALLHAGRPHLQDEVAEWEATAHTVRNFQPTVVPGLLQTTEYAHRMIPLADITGQVDHAAAAMSRLERQQVLFDEGKRFEFVITEAALRWPPAPGVLPAQRDRIVSLATLDNVSIGVLPGDSPVAVTAWHNFAIYEADAGGFVSVEAVHGPLGVHDPADVEVYRALHKRLAEASLTGDDLAEFLRRLT